MFHERRCLLSVFTAVAAGILSAGSVACGDVLIDDFDEDAAGGIVRLIDNGVETLDVGPFDFRRSVRLIQVNSSPVGGWQINSGEPSTFTMDVGQLNSGPPTLDAIVDVSFLYEIPTTSGRQPFDVSEGGRNNAFFVDFRALSATLPPEFFRIGVGDSTGRHFAVLAPVPRGDSPFTLVFRREEFIVRAGSVLPDFSELHFISINFRVVTSSAGPADLGFHAVIDRIRVGYVPEPHSAALAAITIAGAVILLRRPLNGGRFNAIAHSHCRRR